MSDDPALDNLKRQLQDVKREMQIPSFKQNKSQSLGGKFFNVGIELVSGVIVGVGVGLFVDWMFQTSPWGLIVFFILGSVAGMLNVYRALIAQAKKVDEKDIHG